MKKTYIQPQQQTVKVAPFSHLLGVSGEGNTKRITIEGNYDSSTDVII